jgi:hypothetical protein
VWVAVVAGGRGGTVSATIPLWRWLGLLSATGYRPGHSWTAGLVLFLGMVALVLLWLVLWLAWGGVRLSSDPEPRVLPA